MHLLAKGFLNRFQNQRNTGRSQAVSNGGSKQSIPQNIPAHISRIGWQQGNKGKLDFDVPDALNTPSVRKELTAIRGDFLNKKTGHIDGRRYLPQLAIKMLDYKDNNGKEPLKQAFIDHIEKDFKAENKNKTNYKFNVHANKDGSVNVIVQPEGIKAFHKYKIPSGTLLRYDAGRLQPTSQNQQRSATPISSQPKTAVNRQPLHIPPKKSLPPLPSSTIGHQRRCGSRDVLKLGQNHKEYTFEAIFPKDPVIKHLTTPNALNAITQDTNKLFAAHSKSSADTARNYHLSLTQAMLDYTNAESKSPLKEDILLNIGKATNNTAISAKDFQFEATKSKYVNDENIYLHVTSKNDPNTTFNIRVDKSTLEDYRVKMTENMHKQANATENTAPQPPSSNIHPS